MRKKIFIYLLFVILLFGCSPANVRQTANGIRFSISRPDAVSVAIAGSFNGWSTSENVLSPVGKEGEWGTTIRLQPGRYEYLFLIDGKKWVLDPDVPAVNDGFGGKNSVIYVE